MKVKVKVYATLREYLPSGSAGTRSMELGEGTSIRQLLGQLRVPEKEVAFVFVNSAQRKLDQALDNGDEVGVFPPIAGG